MHTLTCLFGQVTSQAPINTSPTNSAPSLACKSRVSTNISMAFLQEFTALRSYQLLCGFSDGVKQNRNVSDGFMVIITVHKASRVPFIFSQ